ncbi:mucin-3A-like [Topomyia yanbarensis]|uniref:mucin-3A-like n=1 Tax=Topomyia yanbarensis TaxID=2498891 RepID=UPI00273C682F|nr:mucin-3A-like [Topomyia yanbarensis]XP_058836648.1 mucin-3A-like [Topomyia yanbarensis]XP_058836649.1 mucin-3A-like [Topomyia yanbarensis]
MSSHSIGTMKKRAKLAMSSLALTLLCCCSCMLALASGLPITSKPLDSSPDHLTWQAAWLSGDSRTAVMGGKAKKIPKSIFIAPQLNGYNGSLCPPDTKIDYNGKCIHVVNINTADILVTKLQSILGNGAGAPKNEDDYDYDDDSSGPFQVNLPLSIDLPFEQPALQSSPVENFYDTTVEERFQSPAKNNEKQSPDEQQSTFLADTSKQPIDQTPAESHTDISFVAFESLPNGTLSTQLEMDGNNGTVLQNIFLTSTPISPTTVTMDTVDADSTISASTNSVANTDTTSTALTTTELVSALTTDIASSTESSSLMISSISSARSENQTIDGSFSSTTQLSDNDTTDDDLEGLKTELAEESLLLETSAFLTTDMPSTDVSDVDTEHGGQFSTGSTAEYGRHKNTENAALHEISTMKVLIHTMSPTPPLTDSSKPVEIVTPLRTKWYGPPSATPSAFIDASYTQQDRTTRATPETTTVAQHHTSETPLLVLVNDTDVDKKNRVSMHRQEMKENLRETMDTNNRFVYHHLSAPSPPSIVASTTTEHNYIDQLRKINEIIAENKQRDHSRIRFPTHDDDQQTSASNNNKVRFPGSVSNRGAQYANRLSDIYPKKTSESTTQRPPFWWLPSGWEVDQTGQKPMLLRFWSRMPLVRDQSISTSTSSSNDAKSSSNRWRSASVSSTGYTHSASVAPRGNSRSPSENFYKEVSTQDIYKVLNMRQLKHKR